MNSKFIELFKNEEIVKKLEAVKDQDEMISIFQEAGLNDEEIVEVMKTPMDKYLQDAGVELGEEDLEDVSGGSLWGIIKGGVKIIKKTWDVCRDTCWGGSNTKMAKGIIKFWTGIKL